MQQRPLVRKDGGAWRIVGDPTEGALLIAAAKGGHPEGRRGPGYPAVEEIPFDSERKRMTIVRPDGSRYAAFVKGAPDMLLDDCTPIDEGGATRPLTAADRARLLGANDELADRAMRVLAVAYRPLEDFPRTVPGDVEPNSSSSAWWR